jgi:hypothetical protein
MDGIIEIVIVFISMITLLVFVSQTKPDAMKIKLDLYNKRFDVYKSALNLYTANCWHWNNELIRPLELQFVKSLKESQFLFGEENEIHDILEKIKDCNGAIAVYEKKRLEIEDGNGMAEQGLCMIHKNAITAHKEFDIYLTRLEDRVKRYLHCKTIVPRDQLLG